MADTKQVARAIFHQTLSSIDIVRVMERKLCFENSKVLLPETAVDLAHAKKVLLVAIGKAAHAMVDGFFRVYPGGLTPVAGIVAAPTPPTTQLESLDYFICGHPLPNEESWRAAQAILQLLQTCDEQTVVFFLLSGGGSALVELPLVPGMKLPELQTVYQALVTCGAPIDAMNTVRRHLSAVKGGRLAVAAGRAQKLTIAVTDVPPGKEHALSSGPTLPDSSTVADVHRVVREYGLHEEFPEMITRWLESGELPETPKPGNSAFKNAHFSLLLGMDDLFHAAHHAAEAQGFVCCCDNSTDDWPVEKAADALLAQLGDWQRENPGQRVALIADGELSSPVTGKGIGGRNSAFVLACVEKIAGRKITVLSAGTDGIDGNSLAAGAVADGETLGRAKALHLDVGEAFRASDAFTFFDKLGDAIVTGPTGNNLRDLRILLAG